MIFLATNYPGGLDSLTNPTGSDGLDNPDHAAQHANINDAMEAVQTALGINPNQFTDTNAVRLESVEDSATADQSDAEIRAAVAAATNSNVFADTNASTLETFAAGNVFTDTNATRLESVEDSATADQSDAEIRAAVAAATDSNVYTDTNAALVETVESGADVTDATNVTAAGAQMVGTVYPPVVSTIADAGTTETITNAAEIHDVTLSTNCTFTITSTDTNASMTLILRQDGTGGHAATWPGAVAWASATAPTLTTDSNEVSVVEFLTVDTGTTWYGFAAGIDMA